MPKIIISLFLSGIFFGSGPCMASCGPVLLSYVVGTGKNIPKGLFTYLLFSLSRLAVYLFLSLGIFILGRLVLERITQGISAYVNVVGGLFIIFMGALTALGSSLGIKPLGFLHSHIIQKDKKSIVLLGLIIGLLPCMPLLAVLSYVGLISKTWLQSLLYSLAFGIGTIISPLILLVVVAAWIPQLLISKSAIYSRYFRIICGLVIIFFGAQLIIRTF